MRLLLVIARAYPRRSLSVLGCLLLGALAEGVGLSTLLPLLGSAGRWDLATSPAGPAGPAQQGFAESGLGRAIERAFAAVDLQPSLGVLLSILVAAMTIKGVLVLLSRKQAGYTVAHVATDLRLSLMRALLSARWSYFTSKPLGSLINGFSSPADRSAAAYMNGILIVSFVVQALLYLSIAFAVSWQGTLAVIAVGGLSLYALSRLVEVTRRAGARQYELRDSLMRRLADGYQAVKPLKAMGREALIGPVMEREIRRLNRAIERQVLSKGALGAAQEPLTVACLALGVYIAVTRWHLSMASVIVLVLLFARVMGSLGKAQRHYQEMAGLEGAFWGLREKIARARGEREEAPGTHVPTFEAEIVLEGVDLAYGERRVVEDASLVIPAGGITVLVGPSGAGKTSIADLIVGLRRPDAGEIRIDGVALSEVDLRAWRSMVGYVPQETFLLHDTVYTNVALGDPRISELDVKKALRRAGAWEFVSQLPEGIDTIVGERGARLSGGQGQRIVLARALVNRPKLLVLDEATTALDPATERSVWEALVRLRGQTAILAISHQPMPAALADRIYRIEAGAVRGTSLARAHLAPARVVA